MLLLNIFLLLFVFNVHSSDSESNPYSVFGDVLYAHPTPIVQLQFPYSTVNTNYVTTSLGGLSQSGSGSLTQSNGLVLLRTGTTIGSVAVLASKDILSCSPGQGLEAIFSAMFESGVSGNTQIIGVGNSTDGFFFGQNGTQEFGILYRSSSAGDIWIYQNSWNVDKLDGTGSSGVTLAPTVGNIYRVQYNGLGFGIINFYVQNPQDGGWILVHSIQALNGIVGSTLPMVSNSSMQLLATSYNNSSTNADVTLATSCMMGAVQGKKLIGNNARYSYETRLPLTTVLGIGANIPYNIFALYNNLVYPAGSGIYNQTVIYPDMLTIYNLITSLPVTFYIYLNPTMNTPFSFDSSVDSNSTVLIDGVSINSVSSGTLLYQITVPGTNDGYTINLSHLKIRLVPGDVLVIATSVSGSLMSNVTMYASLSWTEGY